MCGIFAYRGIKSNAGDTILKGLKSLEYRGYDSWGIALKKVGGGLFVEKQIGQIGSASLPHIESSIGVGHTRWATHGGVTIANAHPHISEDENIVVVHNGIVENYESLKSELGNTYTYKSSTDSEVIVYLIEDELKKTIDFRKAVLAVFQRLEGLNAIIALNVRTEEFVAIKNSSPLVLGVNEQTSEIIIASDSFSILPHTNKLYFLEDNELLYSSKNEYSVFDKEGNKKKIEFITQPIEDADLGLGDEPNYMIKEIRQQPKILENILINQKGDVASMAEKITQAYGTYLIGCGSAYYACLAGTYLFSKLAGVHLNASVGSEFAYAADFLKEKSLVIALSQSGETIDIISSAKKAKEKGAYLAIMTNVLGSTLYRMADFKVLLNAGPEKCVLATKSFTAKIALLYLAAHHMAGTGAVGEENIQKAIDEIKKLVANGHTIRKLADKIQNKKHIYILGRGTSYPLALESALKIKEVSYIHAEGFAGGELKHGVIALIEKGTPVIIYNPEDETYQDTLSSANEVKARGAYVIGISSRPSDVYDEYIEVKKCGEATLIPNVVVAQLLGYYLALAKNLDPDKPRNLAKSVTVK